MICYVHCHVILQNVVSILQNESYAGGMHEDTLLLVMGDHGQTLNGDHGGGALEEVWLPHGFLSHDGKF